MPNMSFMLTTKQIIDETKDVTRRLAWKNVKTGHRIRAVEKGMGLKKGEKVKFLKFIEIVGVRQEVLNTITQQDVIREGFPDMTPLQFVEMFCKHNRCQPWTIVNRIEFKYVR